MTDVGRAYADIRADTSKLDKDLASAKSRLVAWVRKIDSDLNKITMRVDTTQLQGLENQLKKIDALTSKLQKQTVNIDAKFQDAGLTQRLERLNVAIEALGEVVDVNVDVDGAETSMMQLDALQTKVNELDADDVNISVDVDGVPAAKRQLEDLERTARRVDSVGGRRGGIGLGALAGFGGVAALTAGLAAIPSIAVSSAASLEMVETAFTGLLGSATEARDFIADLQSFAAETPFEFDQLTNSAQKLMGTFGVDFRDELIPTLTTIGDLATALGQSPQSIDRVVLALTQMQGKGRLAGQELLQLREALPGFNAVAEIAAAKGISVAEASKQLEEGTIDAEEGIQLLLQQMKLYPGAAGAMEKASLTLNGKISTLKDNFKLAAIEGFEPFTKQVKIAVDTLAASIQPGGVAATALGGLGEAFASGLEEIIPRIEPLITALSQALIPLVDGLGTAINGLLGGITPLLEPVGQVLGDILSLLGPILEALGGFLEPIVEAAAVLTGELLGPLTELVETLGRDLQPAFDALGEAIIEVAPDLVEAISAIIDAIVPLIPPLVEVFVETMPGSIEVLKTVAQTIELIADVLAPLLRQTANFIDWAAPAIAALVSPVSKLGEAIGMTKDLFTEDLTYIGRALNKEVILAAEDAADKSNKAFADNAHRIREEWDMMNEYLTGNPPPKWEPEVLTFAAKREIEDLLDPTERLEDKLNAINETFDRISGNKVNLSQQRAAIQAFLDELPDTFAIDAGFSIDTAEGRSNLDALIQGGQQLQETFSALLSAGVDSQIAFDEVSANYLQMVAGISEATGRTVEEVDAEFKKLGLDPVTIEIAVAEGSREAVLAAYDKIEGEIPKEIDVLIQGDIEEGDFESAQQRIDDLNRARVTVGIDADDSEVLAKIRELEGRRVQMRAYISASGNPYARIPGLAIPFEAGGQPSLADIPSHYADGRAAQFMYGEPSTGGEYFISMHPKFRERNLKLVEEAAGRLGAMVVQPGARAQSHGTSTGFPERSLDRMVVRLERIEKAMRDVAPVTINTNNDDPHNVASKYLWAVVERRRELARV